MRWGSDRYMPMSHAPKHDYAANQFFAAVKSEFPGDSLFLAEDETIEFHAKAFAQMRIKDADARHQEKKT